MLKVAIHHNENVPAGHGETVEYRPTKASGAFCWLAVHEFDRQSHLERLNPTRSVVVAVVHEYELPLRACVESTSDPRGEFIDVALLIAGWHYD